MGDDYERRIEALARESWEIVRKDLGKDDHWELLTEEQREYQRQKTRELVARVGGFGKYGRAQ